MRYLGYPQYRKINKENKEALNGKSSVTINSVDFKHDRLYLQTGESVMIADLLSNVVQGNIYVTNLSLIAKWKCFDEDYMKAKEKKQAEKAERKEKEKSEPKKVCRTEVFELVEVQPDKVIIKVIPKDNLTIARHPYVNATMDYISVTRGEQHVLTIIRKDGSSFSFHWGIGGMTLISENLTLLRKEVVDFITKVCNIDFAHIGR